MTALLRQPALAQPDMFPDARELGYAMNLLTQRYIWYYPTLNQLTGGHKSGLMLGLLLHWSRHYATQGKDDRDGWMWKTGQEWRTETGLTRHEQDSARAQLVGMQLVEERKRGMPARMFYRVRMDELGKQLAKLCGLKEFTAWDWSNTQQVLRLLGRPVAFYLRIAQLSGGATNSLYLSYLLYAQRQAITTAYTVNWIRPRPDHVEKVLGMSYKVQLLARKQLTSMGLVECRSRGFAQSPEMRLRFGRVAELLGQKTEKQADQSPPVCRKGNYEQADALINKDISELSTGLSTDISINKHSEDIVIHSDASIFTFPANSNLPFRQTENDQTGKQRITEPANTFIPNQQTSLPEREISNYTNTTYLLPQHSGDQSDKLAAPDTSKKEEKEVRGSGGEIELDFGEGKSTHMWRVQAIQALTRVDPHLRQAVLDEWVARLESKDMQPVRMPLRFLDKLITSARTGEFRPEMGHVLVEARKTKAKLAKLRQGFESNKPVPLQNQQQEEHDKQRALKPIPSEIQARIDAFKRESKTKAPAQISILPKPANRDESKVLETPTSHAVQTDAKAKESPTLKHEVTVELPRSQSQKVAETVLVVPTPHDTERVELPRAQSQQIVEKKMEPPSLQDGAEQKRESRIDRGVESPHPEVEMTGAGLWKYLRSGVGVVAKSGAGTGN